MKVSFALSIRKLIFNVNNKIIIKSIGFKVMIVSVLLSDLVK